MAERNENRLWLRRTHAAFLVLNAIGLLATGPAFGALVNIKLSPPLANDEDVADFKTSPDGQWVVFRAGRIDPDPSDDDEEESMNLYSVPVEGGTPILLNSLLPPGSTVAADYVIVPKTLRVVYRSAQDEPGRIELYSVAIHGASGSGIKLNPDLPPGSEVTGFVLAPSSSPGGGRVVFRTRLDDPTRHDLYTVPVNGPAGPGIRVNDTSQAGRVYQHAFQASPDGLWIVYLAELSSGGDGLFCAAASGPRTPAVRLNGVMVEGGRIFGSRVRITPASNRVVYIADQQTEDQNELYSVPIRGPANLAAKLNASLPFAADVDSFSISPDSQWVAYFADQETFDDVDLFGVPTAGTPGGGKRINHDSPSNRFLYTLTPPQFSPDSSRVVYQESNDLVGFDSGEVYSVPIDGLPADAVRLNEPLVPGGSVRPNFKVADGAGRVIYMADQDTDEAFELYSVPIEGPAEQGDKISPSLGNEGDVLTFQISPDGFQVAFLADRIRLFFGDDIFRLWTHTTVGARGPSVLHGPVPVAGGDVSFQFAFTPSTNRLVYIADQDTDEKLELYVSSDRPAATRGWDNYE